MSFMSGMMMGAAIGRNIHDMLGGRKKWRGNQLAEKAFPQNCCVKPGTADFSLVSRLAGRRRYRVGALVNNPSLAESLKEELSKVKKLSGFEVNPLTGSILLIHTMSEDSVDKLISRLGQLVKESAPNALTADACCGNGQKKANMPVLYAANWNNTTKMLNDRVRRLTCGWFDVSTLMSVFFLIRGIRKMLLYGQRPSGPTMVWWALHMMKGWKD